MSRIHKVRPILQMEATECGAASLAMILDYYGKIVPLEQLRRECGVSRNGVNAKSIVKAARYHNLETRAVRTSVEGAKSLRTPAIIHWNMDHFLVLCGFDRDHAVLADPAYGMRKVGMEAFSRSFTGIAIELKPSELFAQNAGGSRGRNYIRSCVGKFLPYGAYFLLLELCMVLGSTAILFLNSVFINKILIQGNLQNLLVVLLTLACSGLITAVAMAMNEAMVHRFGKQLNLQINSGFIRRMLRLPIEFFAQRSEGDLVNRQSGNMRMGMNISRTLSPIPGYVLRIAVYLAITVVLDVPIAIIGVVIALANIAAVVVSAKKREDDIRSYSRDMGALQGDISRTIDVMETIKSCGAEDVVFVQLTSAGTQVINTKTKIDQAGVYTTALFSFLNALCSGMILIVGVWEILSGTISTGILISLQGIVAAMLEPVGNVVLAGIDLQTLKGQILRTDDVMHYEEDDKFLDERLEQSQDMDGDIDLDHVCFGYAPLEPPLISDFELKIPKGGSVAITGGSGSGKSTVAKLIAGLYQEDGGSITFHGTPREKIDRYYFYAKVAVVSQNIRLFEGSVLDNITMWDQSIPYEDVVAATKAACIHEDIISRKGGYREVVAENGTNFSGGQRQRIEIARALVKKPSILIMDEATSALDADTEEKIMGNIRALGITRIIVAHRLSTIMDSDEILVMEKGRIVERGTHDALIKKNGAYCALVRSVG